MIQREWLHVIDHVPSGLNWVRYWDLAASVKQSADYTASVRVAFDDTYMYIADGIRLKAPWPDVRKVMIHTMRDEAYNTTQVVEEAMHGLAVIQDLQRLPELAHIAIMGYKVREDKIQRALPWAARAESRLVRIIRGEWVSQFLDEASAFPHGAHDDMVDAVSGAVAMLGSGSTLYDFI
jgi:predicted phage terminase large subunit-like protein